MNSRIFGVFLSVGLIAASVRAQEPSKLDAKPVEPPVRMLKRANPSSDQKSQSSGALAVQAGMPVGPTPTGAVGTPPPSGQTPIGLTPPAGNMALGEPPKGMHPK